MLITEDEWTVKLENNQVSRRRADQRASNVWFFRPLGLRESVGGRGLPRGYWFVAYLRVIVWAGRETPRLIVWTISILLGRVTGCLIDRRPQLAALCTTALHLSNKHKAISQFIIIAFVWAVNVCRPTLLEARANLLITCDKQTLNFDYHIPSSTAAAANNTSFDN